MRQKDCRSDFAKQLHDGIHDNASILVADIGYGLAKVLVERTGVLRELHAGKKPAWRRRRPDAKAKDREEVTFAASTGAHINCGTSHRPAAAAAARLIEDVGGVTLAQKDVLKPFAAVRRGLPGLGKLPAAVPHDERIPSRVDGNLILDVRVIAARLVAIERGDRRAADCET